MRQELFFRDKLLSFIEARYSKSSQTDFKPHIPNSLSIGAIDQGEVLYTIAGQEELLRPGMLAIITPDNIHSGGVLTFNSARPSKQKMISSTATIAW